MKLIHFNGQGIFISEIIFQLLKWLSKIFCSFIEDKSEWLREVHNFAIEKEMEELKNIIKINDQK